MVTLHPPLRWLPACFTAAGLAAAVGMRSGHSVVWVALCMLGLCGMQLLPLGLLRTHRSAGCCWVVCPLRRDAPAALLISLLQQQRQQVSNK